MYNCYYLRYFSHYWVDVYVAASSEQDAVSYVLSKYSLPDYVPFTCEFVSDPFSLGMFPFESFLFSVFERYISYPLDYLDQFLSYYVYYHMSYRDD